MCLQAEVSIYQTEVLSQYPYSKGLFYPLVFIFLYKEMNLWKRPQFQYKKQVTLPY